MQLVTNLGPELRRAAGLLDSVARRQMPFATARALTWTARDAKEAMDRVLPARFDRPTPFTQRAVRIDPARIDTQQAQVFVLPAQARYLWPYEVGGAANPAGGSRSVVRPVNTRLNRYGNLNFGRDRRLIARLASRPGHFVARLTFERSGETISGVWRRARGRSGRPGRLTLILKFDDPSVVAPRLHFTRTVDRAIRATFAENFNRSLAQALATARRGTLR